MTVDRQALRETLDQVIDAAALGNWNQEQWFVPEGATALISPAEDSRDDERWGPECGSGGCFLGHRAILDGARHHLRQIGVAQLPDGLLLTHDPWQDNAIGWTQWGQQRFGIDRNTASVLFNYQNTINDLKFLVDALCAGQSVADFQGENWDDD